LPPLRERREDIPLLAEHFLNKFSAEKNTPVKRLVTETQKILLNYNWTGNVRELENIIEHAVTLCKSDQITIDDLPDYLRDIDEPAHIFSIEPGGSRKIDLSRAISDVEAKLIYWALKEAGGNQVKAAEILNIPRTTLRDKLARLKLPDNLSRL
jgi:DNA-binding NtrC family response regulator